MTPIIQRLFSSRLVWLQSLAASLVTVLLALVVGGIAFAVAGFDPISTYAAMWKGAVGTPQTLGVTVTNSTPLLLAGLGVALAFRCGLVNIGGEGQIYIGALFATLVGIYVPGLPALIHLPLALIAGFIGGGLWGAIAGWMRAEKGLNEVITTIMLNYVGFWIVSYLVHGPLIDPANYGYAWTLEVQKTAQLPIILKVGRINLGFVVALLCAVGTHILLWHTTLGYEMRAVGSGMETARFGGIPVKRSMILSLLIGGGLAGVAGAAVILGVQLRLSDFFSPGYGFAAIAVALIGQTTPIGVVIAALFLGGLISGTNAVQRSIGVPSGIAFLVQGIMMLFVIASQSPAIIHWLRKQRMAQRADRTE